MTDGRRNGQAGAVLVPHRIEPRRGYEFIRAHQSEFPLSAMCRALQLSSSGYYDWLKRPLSERARQDEELRRRIRAIWDDSAGTFGRPRIHAALRRGGVRVSQKRVGRLMKEMGLRGRGSGTRHQSPKEANGSRPCKRGPG